MQPLFNKCIFQFLQQNGRLSLNVHAAKRQPVETLLKLELDGSAMDLPVQEIPSEVQATASNIYHDQIAPLGSFG